MLRCAVSIECAAPRTASRVYVQLLRCTVSIECIYTTPCAGQGYRDRYRIEIGEGTYTEKLVVEANRPPITMVGMTPEVDGVVVTWSDCDGCSSPTDLVRLVSILASTAVLFITLATYFANLNPDPLYCGIDRYTIYTNK